MTSDKKLTKIHAKQVKKDAKAAIKRQKAGPPTPASAAPAPTTDQPSPAVRFADAVRGALSILTALSIAAALLLGQRGMIISLNDLIDQLFWARAGQIVLGLIALALLIYGLKNLRLVR